MGKILSSCIVIACFLAVGCKKTGLDNQAASSKPVANFSYGSKNFGVLPTVVNFTDSSKYADDYHWDFGDGNTSNSKNPTNTYSATKTYAVKLVVSNSFGSDSLTRQVEISLNKPKANFTFNSPNMGQAPTTVNFTNISTGASTYEWFFDNGDTSTKVNPNENYSATKIYNVKLIAINAAGSDSITKQVTVTINKSSDKKITSFSFLKSLNPSLSNDIYGIINGNKISVNVLNGFSKNMIASYTSSLKTSIYVGNATQLSGVSTNDYTSTVDYTIKSEDSTSFIYSVDVQRDSFPEMDNAIARFMSQYNIPGLSLTVVKNDKLVYEQSYGYADIEDNQLTTNENLFRIGSISKLVTRIGILQLQERGLLNLQETVFGTGGVLGFDFGTPVPGSKIDQITINELLYHTSGWAYNPFGEPLGYSTDQMIRDMVTDSALEYNPGDTSIYLSFGYEVLGRIIQKLSNQSYYDYCQQNMFSPSNITDMSLTKTILANRQPHEVKYYNASYSPYDPTIEWEKWPAAAGWIASAKDLAKFITRIDTDPYRPDILGLNILNQNYFGGIWEYDGARNGTIAFLSRIDANFSYSIVMNHDFGAQGYIDLRNLMVQIIHARAVWPAYDLFQ